MLLCMFLAGPVASICGPFQTFLAPTITLTFTLMIPFLLYHLGKLHIGVLAELAELDRRSKSAELAALTTMAALVGASLFFGPGGFIAAAFPFGIYLAGCFKKVREIQAEGSPGNAVSRLEQENLNCVIQSESLIDMNNRARATLAKLYKKCPENEEPVTILLDNLVKSKRMDEAEQISSQYLKLVEQHSAPDE